MDNLTEEDLHLLRSCRIELLEVLKWGTMSKFIYEIEMTQGINFPNKNAWSQMVIEYLLKRLNSIKNLCKSQNMVDKKNVENLIELLGYGKIEELSRYGQEIINFAYPILKNCSGSDKTKSDCRSHLLDLHIIGSKLMIIGDMKIDILIGLKYNLLQECLEKLDIINKKCKNYHKEKELNELLKTEIDRLINIIGSLDIGKTMEYGFIIINAISSWSLIL
jgi:hypothetical protein